MQKVRSVFASDPDIFEEIAGKMEYREYARRRLLSYLDERFTVDALMRLSWVKHFVLLKSRQFYGIL